MCPLCSVPGESFFANGERRFLLCPDCRLIYQNAGFLSPEDEQARYELHNNNPSDEGYVNWLQSFVKASVLPYYEEGDILDFGSGPNPVLTTILREKGYPVFPFDPYFSPDFPQGKQFSLILLCEVLEHIKDPLAAFRRLFDTAEKGCILAVKTLFSDPVDRDAFQSWWYKEDPTHIRFYNPPSLERLACQSGWLLEKEDGRSLAIFRKPSE